MSDGLTLEKLKINERLTNIEAYIIEGKILRTQIQQLIAANDARIDNLEHDIDGKGDVVGLRARIVALEKPGKDIEKAKNEFLKIAVGAITMAVGAFVLWICKLVWGHMGGKSI